jgi:hypothetical protein
MEQKKPAPPTNTIIFTSTATTTIRPAESHKNQTQPQQEKTKQYNYPAPPNHKPKAILQQAIQKNYSKIYTSNTQVKPTTNNLKAKDHWTAKP